MSSPISKGQAIVLAIAAAVAVAGAIRFRGALSPEALRVESADPASRPPLPVALAGGGTRNLAEPPGKTLILHFWATWCPPCVDELPGLVAYAKELKGDPTVELLTVSVDDSFEIVQTWLAKHGVTDLPLALDSKREAAQRFGSEKFPETYVISARGEILDHVKGPMDWTSPAVRARLADLRKRAS